MTSTNILKEMGIYVFQNIYTEEFIAALPVKSQLKITQIVEWINKMWHIHVLEYYPI